MRVMKKIVIHSAEEPFRAMMRGLLVDIECRVVEAESRGRLLDECRCEVCDLVLTDDVRMFQSGGDAAAALQRVHLPYIVLFSHDVSEETVLALLEGCVSRYVVLPCEPTRLRGVIVQRLM